MSKKITVPDAWDDDYAEIVDRSDVRESTEPAPKLTKSERRAQHLQLQKQIWDSAENPSRNHWLEAQGVVPLKQDFKPHVKVLSRKPKPTIAKKDATQGVGQLSLDDEDDDSEEEARKKQKADFEERQRKAKIEREEKERRYAEARERIMGSSSINSSQGRENRKGRGGRGNNNRNSRPTSSESSPAPMASGGQLYDPNEAGKRLPKPASPSQDGPIRQPRGPDNTVRGGFGFAPRGGRAAS
ncbi:hypothetical protein M433DRAFT_157161 [Acidomyces richmondensis BFW]|nr:MAG: hypothetical protein FE78DRAFT_89767 [Acidomyces sp. 'richmondensis']KYG43077.1 hypothetical protein M433DRAFT_157161 [Acidomyces richmondensis BFW]